MVIVDMVIARIWFFGGKWKSVNNCFQWLNLGLLVALEVSRATYWGVWGAEPPRKKGSYTLNVSVVDNPSRKL